MTSEAAMAEVHLMLVVGAAPFGRSGFHGALMGCAREIFTEFTCDCPIFEHPGSLGATPSLSKGEVLENSMLESVDHVSICLPNGHMLDQICSLWCRLLGWP